MADDVPELALTEFVRSYHIRSPNIMWFLGAGCSAAAGVPTAWQMLTEFKRRLYCTETKTPAAKLDTKDPSTLRRIERYFADNPKYPPAGASDEYARLFEAVYPSPADRRRFIDDAVRAGKPSYGHVVLAELAVARKVSAIWTTNFDQLIETAVANASGATTLLAVADLQRPDIGRRALKEATWPVLIKIHGDFQSDGLKNTPQELQSQDAMFRSDLIDASCRFGLAVVGYGGRDDSVMDAFEAALERETPFPQGLFWFNRQGSEPYSRVMRLIQRARDRGVSAYVVNIEAFDELFGEVVGLFEFAPEVHERLDAKRPLRRKVPFIIPELGKVNHPVLRLNAVPIVEYPTSARLIECAIGNAKEVREAIEKSGRNVIAARRRDGVIAFGSDIDMRDVFGAFSITAEGVAQIDITPRGWRDTADMGLCYDALMHALARERGLTIVSRRQRLLAVRAEDADSSQFSGLKRAVGSSIVGTVPMTSVTWCEGISIRIEQRFGKPWVVFVPTIVARQALDVTGEEDVRKEFVRERKAGRYNQKWNQIIDAWAKILSGKPPESECRAFGDIVGINASFRLSYKTAFMSRQGG